MTVNQVGSIRAFQRHQTQEHESIEPQFERMSNEFVSVLKRRVHHDALNTRWRGALHQKINTGGYVIVGAVVRDKIGGNNPVPGRAEDAGDCAPPRARLPNRMRQFLDAQQRMDGTGRRLVKIVLAILQRRPVRPLSHDSGLPS